MREGFIEQIVAIEGIIGCVSVNSQDGSLLQQGGKINPMLEDITAFFGSGFDVVASSLAIKGLKFTYLEMEKQRFIILVKEEGYIGCELSLDVPLEKIIKHITEMEGVGIKEEIKEKGEGEKELPLSTGVKETKAVRFLISKVRQINLLIKEFSKEDDQTQWIGIVKEKFSGNEIGEKILTVLHFDNNIVKFEGELEPAIKEEDISTVSKQVTDALCRKAVESFGAIKAKEKVHNVIEKLGLAK